jgi:hypothetical protein
MEPRFRLIFAPGTPGPGFNFSASAAAASAFATASAAAAFFALLRPADIFNTISAAVHRSRAAIKERHDTNSTTPPKMKRLVSR